ncbi:MAG: hydrogenase 4 subunit B [Candidatus Melainabacteria bacterium]|nr:hydrogenase 4 subunit B [Candidatus Melainabacteria bacterium]MBI3308002.1 hydrogenase 4 subunit B [Candidatus Melainabacteria bacterium]
MLETILLQSSFLGFITAAALTLALSKVSKKLSIYFSGILGVISCCLSLSSSTLALLNHKSFLVTYQLLIPLVGKFQLVIDPLAAFFILLISLLSIPVSIYSIGYLKSEYINKNVGLLCALFHLFILSMILVVSTNNGIVFLILWEVMTLISFFFVISDTENNSSKHAGFIYLLMTHIGSAFLLIAFLILAQYTNDFSFTSFTQIGDQLPAKLKLLLFIFILIGFGTKAGLIPLHIWLPEAHPQAPSHISALMSGVMIKTGLYGIIRFIFSFLSPFPYSWGLILATISILTAVTAIIYASTENNLKRLLAFSSIENMGIVMLPIGSAMTLFSLGYTSLAAFSLICGLFHALNHSLFKGLLFMLAGAINSACHTLNLEKLGGLIKLMPQTAFFFLIGSLAICSFPPFNGFASEWLIFQSLLLSFQVKLELVKILFPVFAVLLGLTGTICAATFVKAFSSIFLALPRSHQVKNACEVSLSMKIGTGMLAVLCLTIGIAPSFVLSLLSKIPESLNISSESPVYSFNYNFIQLLPQGFASFSPTAILVLLTVLIPIGYIVSRILGQKTNYRKTETWNCGVTGQADFEYTPTAYSQPLEVVFSELHTPENFYHDHLYIPLINGIKNLAHAIRPIQAGSLQIYLGYIFITLIICLVWLSL